MKIRVFSILFSLLLIWLIDETPITVCIPTGDGILSCSEFVKVGICDNNDVSKQLEVYLPKDTVDTFKANNELSKNPNI